MEVEIVADAAILFLPKRQPLARRRVAILAEGVPCLLPHLSGQAEPLCPLAPPEPDEFLPLRVVIGLGVVAHRSGGRGILIDSQHRLLWPVRCKVVNALPLLNWLQTRIPFMAEARFLEDSIHSPRPQVIGPADDFREWPPFLPWFACLDLLGRFFGNAALL